jgi:transcriptional regulator with XRE-family HTH domain
MKRPTFRQFKTKALKKPSVKISYEDLEVAYELRKQLIALRQKAGLTQEEIAEKLSTSKSNISRLENVHSSISPKLSTIRAYADAVGYKLKIDFVPRGKRQHNKLMQTDRRTAGR